MSFSTVTSHELRKFGLIMAFVLMGIMGLAIPLSFGKPLPSLPLAIGSIFLLLAFVKPAFLKFVYIAWMKVGHILGWINTRLILGIIFFIIITPMGLIMRLLGNDPMNKKYDLRRLSYRKKVSSPPINHMEKPF